MQSVGGGGVLHSAGGSRGCPRLADHGDGLGYPHPPDKGVPWPGQYGAWEVEQHSEYLLCDGRYASCAQAGGLSCFCNYFLQVTHDYW